MKGGDSSFWEYCLKPGRFRSHIPHFRKLIALLNQWTDDIDLMAFLDLFIHPEFHCVAASRRNDFRFDIFSVSRFFQEDGEVMITVRGEREGARNRGCGHGEEMPRTFVLQRQRKSTSLNSSHTSLFYSTF